MLQLRKKNFHTVECTALYPHDCCTWLDLYRLKFPFGEHISYSCFFSGDCESDVLFWVRNVCWLVFFKYFRFIFFFIHPLFYYSLQNKNHDYALNFQKWTLFCRKNFSCYTRHYRFILTFNIQHFHLDFFEIYFRFHCFCFDCNFVDELYYMRISHISLILFPCYHIHASKEYPLWLFNNRFIQCFNIYSRK